MKAITVIALKHNLPGLIHGGEKKDTIIVCFFTEKIVQAIKYF